MLRRSIIGVLIALSPLLAFASVTESGGTQPDKQLKWPNRTIKIAISSTLFSSGAAIKQLSDVNGAVLRGLQKWEEAANVQFELITTDISALSPSGMSGDGISVITVGSDTENLLAFGKKLSNASAMTRVFYDSRGSITEADIALNPSQQFTTDQTPGAFDLEAVITHEIGHLLGLRHSLDPSAAMFDGVPRNGGLEFVTRRKTLSTDDITKVRALYGFGDPNLECCSTVRGRAANYNSTSGNSIVWLQDAVDGNLVQLKTVGANGSFEFGGLDFGSYKVFIQNSGQNGELLSATAAANASIYTKGVAEVAPNIARQPIAFDLRYIGVEGQLSKRAVTVVPGRSYLVTIAGVGLDQEGLVFGATTKGIRVVRAKNRPAGYQENLSALTFRVMVAASTAAGRYSIFAEDPNHARRYFVGALAVE